MYSAEALKPIREILEHARKELDEALARLKSYDELRALRWRCTECGYITHFIHPDAGRLRPTLPQVRRRKIGTAVSQSKVEC